MRVVHIFGSDFWDQKYITYYEKDFHTTEINNVHVMERKSRVTFIKKKTM